MAKNYEKNNLDISKITNNLYIAASPKAEHRQQLIDLNIRLLINMILQRDHDDELEQSPLKAIRIKTIDFPLTPIPIKKLWEGTEEALKTFEKGESVLVFCKKGIHRSPIMACAILVAQGYTSDEAISLVKSKRDKAKPDDWYIKPRLVKFEKEWNKFKSNSIEN